MANEGSRSPGGFSNISGETLQKAIKELKENPATRDDVVRELRDRILLKERESKVL
jgi:ADP-ribose pyrophosphatase YjhB (NUDIX family)